MEKYGNPMTTTQIINELITGVQLPTTQKKALAYYLKDFAKYQSRYTKAYREMTETKHGIVWQLNYTYYNGIVDIHLQRLANEDTTKVHIWNLLTGDRLIINEHEQEYTDSISILLS